VDGSDGTDTLEIDYRWATDAISSQFQSQTFRNAAATIETDWFNVEQFRVLTGSGDDYIQTGAGRDTVSTGAGDDVIDTGFGVALVSGGDGADRWMANFSSSSVNAVLDLGKASQKFLGGSVRGIESVWLTTGSGDDSIATKIGPTYLYGDSVFAGAGGDAITVGGGQDTVDGSDGDDLLVVDYSWDSHAISVSGGQIGDGFGTSVAYVNVEHFNITGGDAADSLIGGSDSDILTGSGGADQLTGGAGDDRFVYERLGDSTVKAADIILDLAASDVIDLHRIDANTKAAGNQAFHIADKFTKHAGELVLSYDSASDRTSVGGDVNGDGKADFTILLAGDHHDFEGFVL
jgi:Ca2+-binding RTX toxin-like protein